MDVVGHGFYNLFLVVTATIAGSFHSPIPLNPPIQQEYVVEETATNLSQQKVLPPQYNSVKNVLGIEKRNEDSIQALIPSPFVTSVPNVISTSLFAPTYLPSSTPVPTTKPTVTPTPTIAQRPNPTKVEPTITEKKKEIILDVPQVSTMIPERSLNSDTILQLINAHREELKLPALVKDEQLCKLAEYRRPQLYDEIFTSGTVHKGLYDLNLPYYITENMAAYDSEQQILNWWLG